MADPRKISVYFPNEMIRELRHESIRLDRTVSWLVQRCVRIGLEELKQMPSINDPEPGDFDDDEPIEESASTTRSGGRAPKG